jgi:hypothetical protein
MEKAAEKRKRREARKLGLEEGGEATAVEEEALDPNDPYYLAKLFERESQ